ncbi:MAG TPA: methyltransferase [Thermoanaerobaculia bacterium]|nr:methyltransferase [Thermoanaerobaculia bacterium]
MSAESGPPPHVAVMQMVMGVWVAQIASAVAQLGVADNIAKGKVSVDELAAECSANPEALYRLLRAAATIGLCAETAPRHFALTPIGDALRSDAPHSMRDFLVAETAPGHWLPWGRLADAIRRGGPMTEEVLGESAWDYYASHIDEAKCFARGMSNLSTIASEDVARVYEPGDVKRIVDVGGSEGVLLRGLLARVPGARGVLFDRPEIIDAAKGAIASSGMADRIEIVGGDFLSEVPDGADLYVLKSILHDWPDAQCETIVRNVHRAAAPDSRLLVVEMTMPDGPAGAPSPVPLMDMNMLVMLGGRERTASEFGALLARCGYMVERVIPTPGPFSVIEARRV